MQVIFGNSKIYGIFKKKLICLCHYMSLWGLSIVGDRGEGTADPQATGGLWTVSRDYRTDE